MTLCVLNAFMGPHNKIQDSLAELSKGKMVSSILGGPKQDFECFHFLAHFLAQELVIFFGHASWAQDTNQH